MEDLRARTTLFCGIMAFAIAASVLLRGRKSTHWLFAAFCTCAAFWYLSQSLAGLVQAPFWVRTTTVLTVLLPNFAVHLFQSIVPEEPGDTIPPSRLGRVAAILGAPMLVLALTPYHEAPLSLTVIYFYVLGVLAAALATLWRRGHRSDSRAVRERVKFLVVIGTLATIFTLADFLSFLGLYLPPIGAVLAILFFFILAESLRRPRLADVYELVGKLIVFTTLAFALAAIFYSSTTYIGRFGASYLNAVLAAIVFLVLFEPLRNEIEKRVHQFFFRDRFALESSIAKLRRQLAHVIETGEMVRTVIAGLEESRRVTSVAIYLRDADGFERAGSSGVQPPQRLESIALRPLLTRLGRPILLEELGREKDDRDGPLVAAAEALGPLRGAVLIAIRDEEEVVGLLAVADDRVKEPFSWDEALLLDSLAGQMAVAVTNSRIYSRLKERDRLAALGAMAAGLAHEVKNPLGSIQGAAQLLEEVTSGDATQTEFLGIILEETTRLNNIVGSFLDYARPNEGNPVPVDVNGAIRRTVQILGNDLGPELEFSLDLADDLPPANIDPEQLRQVLLNLSQNAAQAMNGAGRITIATARRGLRSTEAIDGDDAPKGAQDASVRKAGDGAEFDAYAARERTAMSEGIELIVRDTGPGIAPKVLANLFVPFFTTKQKGTGLGLAISQRIVQGAGGSIAVASQEGSGTTFTIRLPVA